MKAHRRRDDSCAWFTPREPDRAVRRWADALTHSGRQKVLDVGCGGGRHVVYLLQRGMSVTAGDLSAPALSATRRWLERERLDATLVQLEMTALPFGSETFDAVLSVNVLQHAQPDQARGAVREAWRVLRPGGLFLAVVAGPRDCHCLLQRPVEVIGAPAGTSAARAAGSSLCYEHDLSDLFAGFRIVDTQRHSLRLPPGAEPTAWRGVNWRVWAERPDL